MTKLILTLSVMLCALSFHAQTDLYFKLKKIIGQAHPEINLDNKLLAVNIWSVDDPESRDANKNFERAYIAYQSAKLKGGLNGLVVVVISRDDLSSTATIALTKDGVTKSISLKLEDIKAELGDNFILKNLVFDSSGDRVYKNLPVADVFNSINTLITR